MKEQWKDIKEYEGLYKISNLGKVKKVSRKKKGRGTKCYGYTKELILKPDMSKQGYLRATLYINGKGKKYLIHRLVGAAFIENPNNFPQINHKDENKSNNNIINLEWCNAKYNSNYGTGKTRAVLNADKIKRVANTDYKAIGVKTQKKVNQLSTDGKFIRVWEGMTIAATGARQGGISNCCSGRTHSSGGFLWRYEQ